MHEMVIYGVSFDLVGKQPIVLLKTTDGNKFLPIWIGHPEAAAILRTLQGATTPRPMTHDLVTEMLSQLDAQVVRITVTELRDSTFYAQITVQQDGSEIEIDSRPSDAIALAIRAEAPIFVADRVIEESAQALGRERAAVRAQQVAQHPLLALGIDEVEPTLLLVALQARHELQARVHRLHDRAIGVRDLLSELPDQGISRRRRSRRRNSSR